MEQRLIDANVLIKVMCSNCALFLDKTCDGNRISCYPSSIVREQPTVDAVPVVRCGECKYHWKNGGDCVAEADFFCADGERRQTE